MFFRARAFDESIFLEEVVHILSHVEVKNLKTNKTFAYHLVSPEEADFQTGKIAVVSPVGQGLMGKKVGEVVKIKAPAGLMEFQILSVK